MKVIPLTKVDDTAMLLSNVPETDFVAWGAGVTYGIGDRVRVISNHSIYQSAAAGNTGNDPLNPANLLTADNPTGRWIYVSKTNRWRAFDGRNSAKTRRADLIRYDLLVSRTCDTVAVMGVEAKSVQVLVIRADGTTAYNQTQDLLDTSGIKTFLQYFTFVPTEFKRNVLFLGVPAFPGTTLRVLIQADGGEAAVAVVGYGMKRTIGQTLVGTQPQLVDYSTKETDIFGETVIVERPSAKTVTFNVLFPTSQYPAIADILEPLRATPAVYYDEDDLKLGLIVMGFFSDFAPALATNNTFTSIKIVGVI